jgi:hypothetical protein
MDKTHGVGVTRQHGTMIDHLVDKAEKIDFPHSRYGMIRLYEKGVGGKKGFPSQRWQDRRLGVSAFFRPRGRYPPTEVIVILVSGRVAEPCEDCWLLDVGSV